VSDDDAEYLPYLKRFPAGQFSDLARAHLENGGTGELIRAAKSPSGRRCETQAMLE
jgi:hypothetical protein